MITAIFGLLDGHLLKKNLKAMSADMDWDIQKLKEKETE